MTSLRTEIKVQKREEKKWNTREQRYKEVEENTKRKEPTNNQEDKEEKEKQIQRTHQQVIEIKSRKFGYSRIGEKRKRSAGSREENRRSDRDEQT